MKKKNLPALGLALVLLLVFVMAASIDYRALNSSQFTTSGSVTIISAATITNVVIRGSSSILNGRMNVSSPDGSITEYPYITNFSNSRLDIRSSADDSILGYINSSGFGGGGSQLTNLSASSLSSGTVANARLPDPMTVGTVNATTLQLGQIKYATNGVADVTLIDLSKPYAHTNHTANFTISGFSNIDSSGTNYEFASRCYTNNSVGAKTITLPAAWLDVGLKGNPVYNTNIGVLSVWRIPGFATNYLWVGK